MLATIYQFAILVTAAMAAADCAYVLARARRGGPASTVRGVLATHPLFRATLRPCITWFALQVICIAGFAALGDSARGGISAGNQAVFSLLLLVVAPAGTMWCARNGRPVLPVLRGRTGSTPLFWFLVFLAMPVAATALIFSLVPAQATTQLRDALALEKHSPTANVAFVVHLLISAAVMEEVFFRHYLFNRLAATLARWTGRGRGPGGWSLPVVAAAVVTSLFFAAGHTTMIAAEWPKILQIVLLGMVLCASQWKLGSEWTIGLHMAFNLAMVALPQLLRLNS